MGGATELLEQMEHAGHAGHGGDHGGGHDKGPGKIIGVTMAVLGVMLALCAALVGSHRTELIKTMVEQSNKWGVYQAEAMKFRVMEADYEMLKAISPHPDEIKKVEDTLRLKRGTSGKADDEDTAELKDLIASATEDMADLLTPDPEDKDHIKQLARHYKHDMAEAKEDAEAYDPAVAAHQHAAEWYERGQLAAEIGIVIASVALLLGSRAIWALSVAMGLICASIVGVTYTRTTVALEKAEEHIEEAAKRTVDLGSEEDGDEAAAKPHEAPHAPAGAHETRPASVPSAKPAPHGH